MYIPRYHQQNDRDAISTLIDAYPLGAWAPAGRDGLIANHVPFFLDRTKGQFGTLVGHVSRANTVWQELGDGKPSVVMFQGPQAYITPNWYPGKAEHGKVVPTWNYAVAHAHGVARAVEDREWLLAILNQLTTVHEANQSSPWRVSEAPSDYIDKLLRAIVGIEIPIDRLEGKLKVSQDEDMQDRLGTVAGLQNASGDSTNALAELVQDAINNFSAE